MIIVCECVLVRSRIEVLFWGVELPDLLKLEFVSLELAPYLKIERLNLFKSNFEFQRLSLL